MCPVAKDIAYIDSPSCLWVDKPSTTSLVAYMTQPGDREEKVLKLGRLGYQTTAGQVREVYTIEIIEESLKRKKLLAGLAWTM